MAGTKVHFALSHVVIQNTIPVDWSVFPPSVKVVATSYGDSSGESLNGSGNRKIDVWC